MRKVKLVENPGFTQAYESTPVEHRTRITVRTKEGAVHGAQSGGYQDDLSAQKTDAQIEAKFRGLTEAVWRPERVSKLLDRLWALDELSDVSTIYPELIWISGAHGN